MAYENNAKPGKVFGVVMQPSDKKAEREHPAKLAHLICDCESLEGGEGKNCFLRIAESFNESVYSLFPNLPYYTLRLPF